MKNNKSLGQHWLYNRQILDEIANLSASSIIDKTVCLEIGPGLGTLTSSLLKRFQKVVAVEFDKNLADNLPGSFPGKNLEVINKDFLKYDLEALKEPYVVAGNIPYYITSPIINKLLTAKNKPQKVVLLIQKEVAERIVAEKETVLSLFVKNYASPKLAFLVPKSEFTPPPKVDSAVIVLEPYDTALVEEAVLDLIKHGFKNPRKKLSANLADLKPKETLKSLFATLGISENARPADLHLEDWQRLFDVL